MIISGHPKEPCIHCLCICTKAWEQRGLRGKKWPGQEGQALRERGGGIKKRNKNPVRTHLLHVGTSHVIC